MQAIVKSFLIGTVLAVASLAAAADTPDPAVGTWTLDVAKSKLPPGHEIKSQTRVYSATPDGVSLQVTGVAADGSAISQQSIFKYDGKTYPWTGAADYDAISLKRINGSTVKSTLMKGGKTVGSSVRSISMHGKLLTLTSNLKSADGKPYRTMSVFDKQ